MLQRDNLNSAGISDEEAIWLRYGKSNIIGASNYFHTTIMETMGWQVRVWQAAELCNPIRMCTNRFSSEYVHATLTHKRVLQLAPALGLPDVAKLITELSTYKSLAAGLAYSEPAFDVLTDSMPFWRAHQKALPTWAMLVRIVVAMPTSSAASERAFSILNNTFGDKQHSTLQDQVSTSCMLQYNERAIL